MTPDGFDANNEPEYNRYVNNMSPEQAAQTVKQLRFDYHYWQSGLNGARSTDNAVDNWGWDAYTTWQTRLQYGYSWVPGAGEPPVQLAPGLSMPGNLTPYDPNHPSNAAIMMPAVTA